MTVTHTGIIVHCAATRPDWLDQSTLEDQVAEIRSWHTSAHRNWRDIGYHIIIGRNGDKATGRPLGTTGAHAKGHNSDIGICLIGGFGSDADDIASDHFTPAQLDALYGVIKEFQARYKIPDAKVIGHNRVAAKACPGFRVQKWLASEQIARNRTAPERSSPTQSNTVRASAATVAASAGSAVATVSSLDSTAQYIVLGFTGLTVLLGLYIMRERLIAWSAGWR
jgi:N-acetylmuramoyl-L-alanine amidase